MITGMSSDYRDAPGFWTQALNRFFRAPEEFDSERGSISPLIMLYFTVAMLMAFVVSNVASTYVARRDLINTTEAALSIATQELDEWVYYYRLPTKGIPGSNSDLVPINCSDAGSTFSRELAAMKIKESPAKIISYRCDGYLLGAIVEQEYRLPFAASILGVDSFTNRVDVSVQSTFR